MINELLLRRNFSLRRLGAFYEHQLYDSHLSVVIMTTRYEYNKKGGHRKITGPSFWGPMGPTMGPDISLSQPAPIWYDDHFPLKQFEPFSEMTRD